MIDSEIVILGGGLTGLILNYLLKQANRKCLLLEARDRLGGRSLTTDRKGNAPIDLGATWWQKDHIYLQELLSELNLTSFSQKFDGKAFYEPDASTPHQLVALPQGGDSNNRIQGGTSTLIAKLAIFLPADRLYLNQEVQSIRVDEQHLIVATKSQSFRAQKVISTIPPFLLQNKVAFTPQLPAALLQVMQQTHSWMGDSIKIGLTFAKPFWKSELLSGTVFSNAGPITELYDHSNFETDLFALKGFMNNSYYSATKQQRKNLALNQLRKYYGKAVDDYLTYEELVWRNEAHTFVDYSEPVFSHQNNGHAIYQKPLFDNRLYIAGSETSAHFPGYMEGAAASALWVYTNLMKAFSKG